MMIAALSFAAQHTMPPKFGRKWGAECLNTRLPLPTLLHAGYSVKLKKNKRNIRIYKTPVNTPFVATRTRDLQYNFS